MITSTDNTRVKWVSKLQSKKKERDSESVFIAEGIRIFKETPPDRLSACFVTEECLADNPFISDICKCAGIEPDIVSDKVFNKISDTQTPQGVLGVVKRHEESLSDILNKENGLYVILENLQDPGNLGTIIRMSEASGVSGVILNKGCVDLYSPKTVRSTMGSVFRVPVTCVDDLHKSLDEFKKRNIRVYATAADTKNLYTDCKYTNPSAFLIGNEGKGLSRDIIEAADETISIRMMGQIESLNASIACTVLCFEAMRQRFKK